LLLVRFVNKILYSNQLLRIFMVWFGLILD